jgi:mono/diheme cytochrome c family protein
VPRRLVVAAVSLVAAIAVGWPRAVSSHETVNTTVLFDREIVRVLNSHCVMCHVEGGPSFPLTTYEDVWLQRRKISAAVIARRMPPWPAMPGYGRFANENVVTLRESQFVVSWMEGLGPRNSGKVFTNTSVADASKATAVRAHADFTTWPLGMPDVVRELPPTVVEANQPDDVKRTVIDLGLTTDSNVKAVQYLPADRGVVRAAVFTVQETGQWIGSWTPWHGYTKLPEGVAFRLPARSHVVADISYQHGKERVVDRGRLGLMFDSRAGSASAADLILDARRDSSDAKNRLRAETTIAADTMVLAMRPETTAGITSLEVKARRLDGGTDVLLFAKDFSPKWPTPFVLAQPVLLRKGATLSAAAYADATTAGVRVVVSTFRLTRTN